MSKKISINLAFQSDTRAAKAAIKDLSHSLTQLQNQANTKIMMGEQLTTEMSEAATAATKLQAAMRAATDPTTGQVNMVKMNATLKTVGTSMHKVREAFIQGGREGVQAFVDLNNAVLQAQVPMKRTQTMVDKMWNTLGNTVRWQISAQAIQTVTTGLSEAFQYAQDLNTSLNNIRIVTGKSQETMEQFAKTANDAAKALSTTTTAYTDAALIYYQQGLSDDAVKERTDITIKLANAVGETAASVSEWMTAIWNNFDDGTKSLEYYADVLAALGASTASSADEIARGLEKFIAVADTVGLSYEYATSALTTVTAETRQSADVVGTAFKTMFARIQDLDLGKTLEDGTTLGEYSQALASIGVAVKDAGGELRSMDDILNDLGARWDKLTQAQQVSVAQSVAGIRQYNQMLALMNNWEAFQQNITTAQSAAGATDSYQETYAQSWEAAKKRVTASAEAIYDSLLNDEFFITLNNGLANTLSGFDKLLDAMGGLKGLLPLLTLGISRMFGPKIISSIQKFTYEMSMSGQTAAEELHQMQLETLKATQHIASLSDATSAQQNATEGMSKRLSINSKIADLEREGRLTPQAQATISAYNAELDARAQNWIDAGARQDQTGWAVTKQKELQEQATKLGYKADDVAAIAARPESFINENATKEQKAFINEVKTVNATLEQQGMTLKQVQETEAQGVGTKRQLISVEKADENAIKASTQAKEEYEAAIKATDRALEKHRQSLDLANNVNKLVSGFSSATFAIVSFSSAIRTLNDPDMSGPEKLLQVLMSLSMILPTVISAVTNLKNAQIVGTTTALLNGAVNKRKESIKLRNETKENAKAAKEGRQAAKTDREEAMASREAAEADREQAAASREAAAAQREKNPTETSTPDTSPQETPTQNVQKHKKIKKSKKSKKKTRNSKKSWEAKRKREAQAMQATRGTPPQTAPEEAPTENTVPETPKGEEQKPTVKPEEEKIPKKATGKDLGKAAVNFAKTFGPTILLAGAAIAVGKTVYDLYNKTAKALENTKQATASVKKVYEETLAATNELKQSIDGFKEKQNSLDGLVKGTLEYKEALLAANEEARKLIQENDLVAGQDYQIVNGQIEINEEALDRAYEQQLIKQQNASNTMAITQMNQNQAELANEKLNVARDLNIADDGEQAAWGLGVGATAALAAAAVATIFTGGLAAPLLAAAGAAVIAGTAGGLLLGGESDKEVALLEQMQKDAEDQEFLANEEDFKEYLYTNQSLLELTDSEIQELVNNREAIKDLIESNQKLETSNRLLYQQRGQGTADTLKSKGIISEDEANIFGGSLGAFIEANEKDNSAQWSNFTEDLDDADLMLENLAKELGHTAEAKSGDKATLDGQDMTQRALTEALVAELQNLYFSDSTRFNEVLSKVKGHSNSLETVFLRYFGGDDKTIDYNNTIETDRLRTANLKAYGIKDNDDLYSILESKARGEEFELGSIFTWKDYALFKEKNTEMLGDMSEDMRKALLTFEEDKKKITQKNNKNYDENTVESTELQGTLSDLQLTQIQANAYSDALQEAYSLSEDFANSISSTNLHFKNYISAAGEVYSKYSGVFKKGEKTSLEFSKGIGEMTKVMSHLFVGLGEDTEFVSQNIGLIMSALEGEEGKLAELQRAATLRSIELIDGTEDVKNQITTIINSIPTDIKIGTSLSAANIDIAALNQALIEGKVYLADVRNTLETAGWEIVETTTEDGIKIIDKFLTKWVGLGTEDWTKALNLKDKEVERYHEIDEVLDTISKKLAQIEKIKERVFGKKAINDAFALQLEEQQNKIDALKKKLVEAQGYLNKDASKLAKYGFTFDQEGHITNYKQNLEALGTEERQNAEKIISNFEAARDLVQQLAYDIKNEEYVLNVTIPLEHIQQGINFEVEIKGETQLTQLNFLVKHIRDNAYEAAEAIGDMGKQALVYGNNFNANWQSIDKLLTLRGASTEAIQKFKAGDASGLLGLELYSKDFEALRQYQSNMISSYESMKQAFDGIFEKMDGVFEKVNEEFKDLTTTLEHTASVLKSYQNIIDLAGASTLGISDAMQMDIIGVQMDVAQTSIINAKAQYDKNQEMLAEAREGFAAAQATGDQVQIDKWEASIKTYEAQVRESEQAWLEALANGQELANQRREKAIDVAIKEFLKETTGYSSMDELQQIYNQQKQLRDLYVADYEKVYSLSKLSRQLEKSINDTSSIGAKKQLLALEEKINKAKEAGVKMSSYELSNLEREYQIELAKIALAEAQNAKSVVRLQRNAEGGMSYVYTADQSAIDEAQQKYEDAIYASQKANEEWLNSAEDGLMQATATYIEQLATINNATYDSVEERNEAIAALNEWYLGQQKFYTGQVDTVLKNNSDLYNGHIGTMDGYYKQNDKNFYTMTDSLIDSSDRFIFHFEDTLLGSIQKGLVGGENSAQAWYTQLVTSVGGADGSNPKESLLGKLNAAQDDWYQNTQKNFENGGLATDKFREALASYLGDGKDGKPGVKKTLTDVSKAIDELTKKTDFSAAKTAAIKYASEIGAQMRTTAGHIQSVNGALSDLIDWWGKVEGLENKKLSVDVASPINNQRPGSGKNDGLTFALDENAMFDIGASVGHDGYHLGVISNLRQNDDKEYEYQIHGSNRWYNESDLSLMDDPQKWKSGTQVFLKDAPQTTGQVMLDLGKEVQINSNGKTITVEQSQLIKDNRPTSYTFNSTKRDDASWWSSYDKNGNYQSAGYHTNGDYIIDGISSKPVTLSDNGKTSYLFRVKYNYSDGQTSSGTSVFYMSTGALNQILGLEGKTAKEGILLHYNFPKFDTGGYTGEWGPEGRLAMLHQKEIVLNAHDTENILSVVDMVRQMATQLDFNALAMARGLGGLVANTMVATPQTIDQNVTITAEFPNATNREEIKEAFGDLVNLAAQYVNRK